MDNQNFKINTNGKFKATSVSGFDDVLRDVSWKFVDPAPDKLGQRLRPRRAGTAIIGTLLLS